MWIGSFWAQTIIPPLWYSVAVIECQRNVRPSPNQPQHGSIFQWHQQSWEKVQILSMCPWHVEECWASRRENMSACTMSASQNRSSVLDFTMSNYFPALPHLIVKCPSSFKLASWGFIRWDGFNIGGSAELNNLKYKYLSVAVHAVGDTTCVHYTCMCCMQWSVNREMCLAVVSIALQHGSSLRKPSFLSRMKEVSNRGGTSSRSWITFKPSISRSTSK